LPEAVSHQPASDQAKRNAQPVAQADPVNAYTATLVAPGGAAFVGDALPDARLGTSMRADAVTKLQRERGNQYVQRLIVSSLDRVNRKPAPSVAGQARSNGYGSTTSVRRASVAPGTIYRIADADLEDSNATVDPHEAEAQSAASDAIRRLSSPSAEPKRSIRPIQPLAAEIGELGAGRAMSPQLTRQFEEAFDWDFKGVRLHAGNEARAATAREGAQAFTQGRNIAFASRVADPEAAEHRNLLAHELAHVVQQDKGSGATSSAAPSLSAASPAQIQAAPLVTNVVTSAAELGVGGTDVTATATVGGKGTRLTWSFVGGAAPAGVSIIGTGNRVRVHAAQAAAGAAIGGVPLTVRAAVNGTPGDFFDAPPIMLVQVVSATYAAAPALAAVPSLIPGAPPANTAEPNRDGIAGNTATVNAVTLPAARPVTVSFRKSLGAAVAGNVVTPGSGTGDIGLRIEDTATRARMNETQPAAAGPAARMADLTVNAVPTRVSSLAGAGALGPYGVLNTINFASSDALHNPLTRIVGELITNGGDGFNIPPPNAGFNAAFLLGLAVPANNWNDQLITPSGINNAADGRPAIDVNRFVGPGVPHLPRVLNYRQRFQYASWAGGGGTVSNTIADGNHIRSLIGSPGAFRFKTEHRFGGAAAPPRIEPYVGNPLIVLSGVRATPTAGAGGLAADNAATANLAVNSTVPGRSVNWSVLSGDVVVSAGNPAALPATATLRAGVRSGTFRLRAADTIFPNRQADGVVTVRAVRLSLRAGVARVPKGVLVANVTATAGPGPRTVNWTVDAAAAAAGVTVNPPASGPGVALPVTVNRPAGFTGQVTVTATDGALPARNATIRLRFL
jgi:hypothetical protein